MTGCDAFSTLSDARSSGKHCALDMEALVGDPKTGQEVTLILNQYGMNDLKGPTGETLKRLKTGSSALQRQLVENEDYSSKVLELMYEPRATTIASTEQPRSGNGPGSKPDSDEPEPEGGPRSFAPGGGLKGPGRGSQ